MTHQPDLAASLGNWSARHPDDRQMQPGPGKTEEHPRLNTIKAWLKRAPLRTDRARGGLECQR